MHQSYPSETAIRDSLLQRSVEFSEATGMSRSEIGKAAVNDPAFLHQVAKGRNFTVGTYAKAMGWLDEHWPRESPTQQGGAQA